MSHEIRTPMNGVIGHDRAAAGDRPRRRAARVRRDRAQLGEALLTVINDILDFSKIETGKLEIEDIEFGMRTLVEDVVDLLAGSAQAKGLELMALVDDRCRRR